MIFRRRSRGEDRSTETAPDAAADDAVDATIIDEPQSDADRTLIDTTQADSDATVIDLTQSDADATIMDSPTGTGAGDDDSTILDISIDLDATQTDAGAAQPASPLPAGVQRTHPDRIGHFKILGSLGEGGMGAVYLAQQSEPVERKVALKVIHASIQSRDALLRFEAERQAMARLSHPNVAALYEAGATPDGFPYFAMEAVSGAEELMPYCDQRKLPLKDRLKLFVDVCAGVTHAHQKGILHRDLKPSNILVTEIEGEPVPKIIDFGIAKAVDEPLTESADLTGHRAIGTPAYMSPEALAGSQDLDTRTDVYSLGVVLYEVLLGTKPDAPLKVENKVSIGPQTTRNRPVRPSTRLLKGDSTQLDLIARRRNRTLNEMRSAMRGDLDWIIMKAIAEERDQRYDSVAEFGADVERHLRFEPVLASPPSLRYRAGRFVRRNRLAVAAAMMITLALIFGIIGTTVGLLRARAAESEARLEASRAAQVAGFMTELFRVSDPGQARGTQVTARELLDRGAERIERELTDQPVLRQRLLATMGDSYRNLGLYDDAVRLAEAQLAADEERLGTADPGLSGSLSRLGNLYRLQGRFEDSEALLVRAIALQRSGSVDDLLAAETRTHLASVLVFLGRGDAAEARYEQALELLDSEPPAHPDALATTLHHYGWFLGGQQRYEEAIVLLERAARLRREVLGSDHFELADTILLAAAVERDRGRFDLAEARMMEGLAIQRRVLEPDHPDVAQTYLDLGTLYRFDGRPAEAAEQLERAVALLRRSLGSRHAEVARALGELATNAYGMGEWSTAAAAFREQHSILEEAVGADQAMTGIALNNLGAVLSDGLGELEEGERVLRRAVAVFEIVAPVDRYWQALSRWSLANNLRDQARFDEAKLFYEEAADRLTGGEARRRADNPDLDLLLTDYAIMLRAAGDEAAATELETRFED